MPPSSSSTSQITPAGEQPASRARSTAASVWPARRSTPPGSARSGKMWPGRVRSSGRVAGSTRVRIVDRAIVGRGAGGDAAPGVHRGRERGAERRRVVAHHHRDLELVEPLAEQRHADQAPAVLGHEVHRLRGRALGGHDEVALVLAILVVDHDEHPARADLLDAPPRWWRTRVPASSLTSVPLLEVSSAAARTCRSCPSPGSPSPARAAPERRTRQRVRDQHHLEGPRSPARHREAHAVHRHRALGDQELGQVPAPAILS